MIEPLLLTEWGWYWCSHCGRSFPKGWSDAAAKAEHDDNFPTMTLETSKLVCDDCYKEMEKWWNELPTKEREAIDHQMYEEEIERVILKAAETNS